MTRMRLIFRFSPWALLLSLGLLAKAAHGDTLYGFVVGLSDGDTVTVLDSSKAQHKVRLGGIDAPEKKQAFGERSRQSLSDLVFHKQVEVEFSKTDRYGRIVGKVLVSNVDAGLEQVKRGLAWHSRLMSANSLQRTGCCMPRLNWTRARPSVGYGRRPCRRLPGTFASLANAGPG